MSNLRRGQDSSMCICGSRYTRSLCFTYMYMYPPDLTNFLGSHTFLFHRICHLLAGDTLKSGAIVWLIYNYVLCKQSALLNTML